MHKIKTNQKVLKSLTKIQHEETQEVKSLAFVGFSLYVKVTSLESTENATGLQ